MGQGEAYHTALRVMRELAEAMKLSPLNIAHCHDPVNMYLDYLSEEGSDILRRLP